MKILYGEMETSREKILQYCLTQKEANPSFRIVDVGGVLNSWSKEVADLVIDFNADDTDSSLRADICSHKDWEKIISYVEKNGKFDYAICTHTLEDLVQPFIALENLPKIASAGVITMPSIKTELSEVESQLWVGYIHHRWFFSEKEGEMYIIPKLPIFQVLASISPLPELDKKKSEIQYHWVGEIKYSLFMNGFHGPTMYRVYEEANYVINNLV